MSTWTLNGLDPGLQLNIEKIKMHHQSLADGRLTFRCSGIALDAAGPFENDDIVTLSYNGSPRWVGPVIKHSQGGNAGAEWHDYEVASPWHWLEHTPYLQVWTIRNGAATSYKSRVIVGVDISEGFIGGVLTMAQAVQQVLAFASGPGGLSIAAGNLDLPGYFKVTEMQDVSCAEAIKAIIKWQPDVVGAWDLTTGTPALHITRRANFPAVLKTIDGLLTTATEFTPRTDLVPNGVVICYEQQNSVNGHSCPNLIFDAAPADTTGAGYKQLFFTVPLQGSQFRFVKELIQVTPILIDPTTNMVGAQRYVGAKLNLNGVAASVSGSAPPAANLTFYPLDSSGDLFWITLADATEEDGSQDPLLGADDTTGAQQSFQTHPNTSYEAGAAKSARLITLDTTLPNELLHGRLRPSFGAQAQKWQVTCRVSYFDAQGALVGPTIVGFQVMATDAVTKYYTELDNATIGETPPAGVAAQIYDALRELHYEGSIETIEQECSGSLFLGGALNVFAGDAAWTGMNAAIQEVIEEIDTGKTTARVGPPRHLAPADFIEMQRAFRAMVGKVGFDVTRAFEQASGMI